MSTEEMLENERREFIETVARKLRAVVREYGEKALFGVSIASGNENIKTVCGFHHYFSPGLSAPILILRQLPELQNNLTYKASRLFEDTL